MSSRIWTERAGTRIMQRKLSESINSFFTSNRVTVSSLVRDMKANKTDIRSLFGKLSTGDINSGSTAPTAVSFSVLTREPLVDLFRDHSFRISKLFNLMNTSGMILDSMTNVLTSEIEKVEKDIQNLELFINNYEFLAGKDDLYNANYVEKFDNSANDYTADGYNFEIPDRNGLSFPAGGNSFIDSSTGMMKIGTGQSILNISKNVKSINITSNYDNYISSQTSFDTLFNDTLTDAWNVTIKSPVILTSKISKFDNYIGYDYSNLSGAFSVVEVVLNNVIELDTIRFTPNYGNGLQLVQLVLINATDLNQTNLNVANSFISTLNSPVLIDNKTEISFNKTSVSKLIFIFNQSSYIRSRKPSVMSELNGKALHGFVEERMKEKKAQFSKVQDIAYWYFLRKYSVNQLKKNNSNDNEYYSYRFPQEISRYSKMVEEEVFNTSNFDIQDRNPILDSPIFIDLFRSMMNALNFDNKFFDYGYYIHNSANTSVGSIDDPGFIGSKNSNKLNEVSKQYYSDNNGLGNTRKAIMAMLAKEEADAFEYVFSLKNIEFISTITNQADKAAFVSKKMPVDGNVLGIKAKVYAVGENRLSISSGFDLNQSVSYELSISNEDNPKLESDWIPLAFNDSPRIESEVAFFDTADFSYSPRFTPKSNSIILFKDGMIVSQTKYNFRTNDKLLELIDRSIFSPTSIFCISYEIDTEYNPFELDLVKANIYKESIKRYNKDNYFGQLFHKTGQNNTVILDFIPYVNSSKLNGARYDSYSGTIFAGSDTSYSPVRVKLADGSYATNLTNYTTTIKDVKFYNSNSVFFIQTGKYILFNQQITQPFFVEYEYIPYSLRFRFIMRKNIKSIDAPVKADSIVLKMKTANVDPYYDKLTYISKIK
jgi:hypothetical protein